MKDDLYIPDVKNTDPCDPCLTAEATAQGLGTCSLGWFDDEKVRSVCKLDQPVRVIITLGYANEDDPLRKKVRKELSDLISYQE